ncbi:hypothetical protein IWQ60_003418 [Tieghemiomyces parasiticus]|uniref:Histidinol-phosphatase n=1 Tax=Tieghemiomyces parasiticus TaxID=78921 RepID=A0A9W8DWG4_9FUNG|nr:hypothetical protein IWQ60_003418 [Tieghemiomyces parasiticus]
MRLRHLSVADLEDTFERYVATARALQRQHRSASFDLLVGAETEYINDESLVRAHQLRERHSLDYLVGSVHHVREIPIDFDQAQFNRCLVACGGSLIDLYADYFDAQYRMLTALRPEVVGHFDLCRLFTPRSDPLCRTLPPSVWERVLRNIDVVVAYGGLFEINSRAYKKGLPDAYPQRDILQAIKDRQGKFTISDDSHGPSEVGLLYPPLRQYLLEMGVDTVYWPRPRAPTGTIDSPLQHHAFPGVTTAALWE